MPDASQIPLEANPPSLQAALAPMSSLLNLQQGVGNLQLQRQAIQSGDMSLQAQTQANQERQNLIQLMQDPNSGIYNADGSPNLKVAQQKIMAAAPQTGGDVLAKMTTLAQNHSAAIEATNQMTDAERARVSGMATALEAVRAGPQQAKAAYDLAAQQYSDPNLQKYLQATSSAIGMMPPDAPPEAVAPTLQKIRAAMMPAGEQQKTYGPTAATANTGAVQFPIANNPNRSDFFTPAAGGASIPNQVPPGSQQRTIFDAAGNPLIEVQGANGVIHGWQKPGGTFIPSGMGGAPSAAPGPAAGGNTPAWQAANADQAKASANVEARRQILQQELQTAQQQGDADSVAALQRELARLPGAAAKPSTFTNSIAAGAQKTNMAIADQDWQATNDQANKAQTDIGILQNIKALAPKAATGFGQDRQAFLAGLGSLVGIPQAELEKTSTDLLAKNSNMLALVGGNTDAARSLAEAANPNPHMNVPAIQHAADQIIAQRQLAVAKQAYMAPARDQAAQGDPSEYSRRMQVWTQNADPRILQLSSMAPADVAAMKSSMSQAEQQAFRQKIQVMRQEGVIQ